MNDTNIKKLLKQYPSLVYDEEKSKVNIIFNVFLI